MSSQAQTRATTKYIKTHLRQYVIRCNRETEADMVKFLDSQDNVTALMKRLIREEMENPISPEEAIVYYRYREGIGPSPEVKGMEDMGMTDLQYKDHLRGLVADLKRVKAAGVSDDAAKEIDALIERFEKALED